MSRNLAIITARGGSKRIPRKNIKEFCGKPILHYSIQAALDAGIFDEVMVSTDDEEIARVAKYFEEKGYKFFPIMAAIAEGTADVINYVAAELAKLPAIKVYEPEPKPQLDLSTPKKRSFNIRVCDGVYFVEDAPWIMDVMNTVDPDDYESLQYFERVIRECGIIDALERKGCSEGDTVKILDIEFDYVP